MAGNGWTDGGCTCSPAGDLRTKAWAADAIGLAATPLQLALPPCTQHPAGATVRPKGIITRTGAVPHLLAVLTLQGSTSAGSASAEGGAGQQGVAGLPPKRASGSGIGINQRATAMTVPTAAGQQALPGLAKQRTGALGRGSGGCQGAGGSAAEAAEACMQAASVVSQRIRDEDEVVLLAAAQAAAADALDCLCEGEEGVRAVSDARGVDVLKEVIARGKRREVEPRVAMAATACMLKLL